MAVLPEPTRSEQFERLIESEILSGTLAVGARLPTERALADAAGVSKSCVHSGIANLARKGFLRIVPRHGVYVADYIKNGTADTFLAILRFNGGRMDEKIVRAIMEIRLELEGAAMRKFARSHTRRQMEKLQRIPEDARAAMAARVPPDTETLAALLRMHQVNVASMSGNCMAPIITNAFREISLRFTCEWIAHVGPDAAIATMERENERLAAGDGDGAVAELEAGILAYLKTLE